MYETKIASSPLGVELLDGFPQALDALSDRSLSQCSFLRAAWYRAGAPNSGSTFIANRDDGTVFAAIPVTEIGPSLLGAKKVPGSYWPFRAPLVATDTVEEELAEALAQPTAAEALGPIWRIGPIAQDDKAGRLVTRAAAIAGWTVLERPLGTTWMFDLAAAGEGGRWPRKSTAKRLRQYERKLAANGPLNWRVVRGRDWDTDALNQMAAIERDSWIARETDGSGAKFLHDHQRALWQEALTDPVIAGKLCATILSLDGRPIAFSFDLFDGPTQYAIASSFCEDMGEYRIGKMVSYRQLSAAREDGIATVDLGLGDGGYKREMGAVSGSDFVDFLIVKSRSAAQMIALKWGGEPEELAILNRDSPYRRNARIRWRRIGAAAALAGSAIAIAD